MSGVSPATLTEAEREDLGQRLMLSMSCNHGEDYFGAGAVCETCWSNTQRIGRLVERILAARTPTATGDDLRDRVTALADEWDDDSDGVMTCGWAADRLSEALCESFAASPAPVVSRPEAEVKAEALREAAADFNIEAIGFKQGWGSNDADRQGIDLLARSAAWLTARAAWLASDPEAGT